MREYFWVFVVDLVGGGSVYGCIELLLDIEGWRRIDGVILVARIVFWWCGLLFWRLFLILCGVCLCACWRSWSCRLLWIWIIWRGGVFVCSSSGVVRSVLCSCRVLEMFWVGWSFVWIFELLFIFMIFLYFICSSGSIVRLVMVVFELRSWWIWCDGYWFMMVWRFRLLMMLCVIDVFVMCYWCGLCVLFLFIIWLFLIWRGVWSICGIFMDMIKCGFVGVFFIIS